MSDWKFYRNGVIVPITEDEARNQFEHWGYLSDERGMASFLHEQLWAEIDRLRADVTTYVQISADQQDEVERLHAERLRTAFVELVAPALKEARDAALEEALAAVSAEDLFDDTDDSSDAAYSRAIRDCKDVIRALK